MDSTIVVKVKHGNTVRRFSARVLSNGLEFNFDGLRNKIRGLFNFSPDADFVLTYSDEDNDKITLVDDEDLMDVVRQKLNPLRILVTLRTENVARTPHESESVTTLGAPVQNPIENLNSAVIKFISSLPEPLGKRIVDSLPEPLRNGAKKMLSDFKTEKGLPSPSRPSESGALTDSSVQPSAITLENFLKFAGVTETGSSTFQKSVPDLISNEKYEKLPSKTGVTIGISNPEAITKDQSASKKKASETNEVVKSRDSKESTIRRPILKAEKKPETLKAEKKLEKETVISKENGSVGVATKSSPVVDALKLLHPMAKSTRDVLEPSKITEISGLAKKSGLGSFEKWNKGQPNAFNYAASPCPFSGIYIGQTSPYHGRNGYTEGPDTIFHYGVQCDGCGVHPISGIRYKSNEMADYDLCSICFTQMGEGDYIRIDRPGTYQYHNRSLNGLKNFSPRMYRAPRVNPSRPRLDSIFIQDVTILDGALMTPSTPFTKIWRMKNNGSVVWPKGTRLIWIGGDKMDKGGDKMGKAFSVDLEISGIGLPVGHELDIAADFIAPDFSGRYMSYWMMMSPTGQKFGQRVWVLIQVDAGLKVVEKALRDFNLNNMPPINTPVGSAPPVSGDIADVLVFNGPGMLNPVSEWSSDKKKVDLNFPIDDNLLVGGGYGSSVLTGGQPPFSPASLPLPSVTYPNNDLLDCFPKFSPGRSDLNVDLTPHINDDSNEVVNSEVVPPMPQPLPPMAESEEENDLETNLLMELDRMGFKEIDLNKEVLRLNEYDLEKCVNDLCGVSEWDPILEELHEMGFNDDVMNKKLLEKNKGSVTQVVLDLLVDENE